MTNKNDDHTDSTFQLVLKLIRDTWSDFNQWMAVNPEDTFPEIVVKFIGKLIGITIFILLSPVIAATLFIAFIIAF